MVKNFQCTNFFSGHSSAWFFFLALHEFFFQSLLAGNFFQTRFPCIIFFFGGGGEGGGGGGGGVELPRNRLLTDRPTYLPDHLPPLLIKMNAARFFYESSNLLFPFYSSVTWAIPSQSARSEALARAVDKPITRTVFSVCEEIKFVRDTMTSRTGPLSSPSKWISSITSRDTALT